MTRPADRYDVVVVGAGLVGLAAAALLAQQGVRVLAVERHAGTSVHPKARLVAVRSMEIYRGLGIEAEVRAAGEPNAGFDVAETLAGGVQSWIAPPADEVASAGVSPTTPYSCDQQHLEPILLRRARERRRGGVRHHGDAGRRRRPGGDAGSLF